MSASTGDPIKDTFFQYQQQVALYAQLSRGVGTHQDNEELRSQLMAQESVVQVSDDDPLSIISIGRMGLY